MTAKTTQPMFSALSWKDIVGQGLDAARFRFLEKVPAAWPKPYENLRKGYFWFDPFGVEHNARSFRAAVDAAMRAWKDYL